MSFPRSRALIPQSMPFRVLRTTPSLQSKNYRWFCSSSNNNNNNNNQGPPRDNNNNTKKKKNDNKNGNGNGKMNGSNHKNNANHPKKQRRRRKQPANSTNHISNSNFDSNAPPKPSSSYPMNPPQPIIPRFGSSRNQKFFQSILHHHHHANLSHNSKQRFGIRSLNLTLVKDSSQVPILIPGLALQVDHKSKNQEMSATQPPTSSQNHEQKHRRRLRRRRTLPTVNAAALLDSKAYCQTSAKHQQQQPPSVHPQSNSTLNNNNQNKNKNATEGQVVVDDAAKRRLLRGKKDLVDMVRGHIVLQQHQRPFCLVGHGVPPQLLQHHINTAHSVLSQFDEPAEIALKSTSGANNRNSLKQFNHMAFDRLHIRGHDGRSRIWAWPPPPTTASLSNEPKDDDAPSTPFLDIEESFAVGGQNDTRHGNNRDEDSFSSWYDISQTWAEGLTLYLAVMDRIGSKLGLVGYSSYYWSRRQRHSQQHQQNQQSPIVNNKQWNVKMYRGMAYPLEVVGSHHAGKGPVPILEWSPQQQHGRNSHDFVANKPQQPYVSIRLQGFPEPGRDDRNDPAGPLTLVYNACLPNDS